MSRMTAQVAAALGDRRAAVTLSPDPASTSPFVPFGRVRVVGVVVRRSGLLTAVVVGSLLSSASPAPAAASAPSCSHLHMIGLRGSGERAYESENELGGTINDVYFQLVQRANYEGVRMTVDGVGADDYPAADAVELAIRGELQQAYASVDTGVDGLEKAMLNAPEDACVVLAGYSQGAWVIGQFLQESRGAKLAKERMIAAIVLFGDPRYDPGSPSAVPIGNASGTGMLRATGKPVGDSYIPSGLAGRTQSYCLANDPICAATPVPAVSGYACYLDPLCVHKEYTSRDGLRSEWVTQDGAIFAAETVFPMIKRGGSTQGPAITKTGSYQDGVLVYLTLSFDDGTATGFGFRGANGAGWAEESHSLTSPSYGKVSAGQLAYPFNHGCGTSQEYESDVEAWIYDDAGTKSDPVTVRLACG